MSGDDSVPDATQVIRIGKAYLVGAGPGDPGLITVRGRDLLLRADAIVYDALANPELIPEVGADGNRIELYNVGKRGGDSEGSARQDEISALIVKLVREGKRVVRLKGGDPLVFGRGGEEAQALSEAGLPFEVVPGVTAGTAAPAYAGIPVTHRGLSTSVTFVTGHEDPSKSAPSVDWGALARANGTIVLYMGIRRLPAIADALIAGGMQSDIPAAVIQWGTTGRQRTVVATLSTLADEAQKEGIGAPAIIVIGWPVVLRDEIAWFDRRPLFGRRILVTRPEDSHGESRLARLLRDEGATVVELRATRIDPIASEEVDMAVRQLDVYDWVMFTSANGVVSFWRALADAALDSRALGGVKVASVGPATTAALAEKGVRPDVTAARYSADGLVNALGARHDIAGSHVLLPCSENASDTLAIGVEDLGATVHRIHTYRSIIDPEAARAIRSALDEGEPDAIVFTSASGVRSVMQAADGLTHARGIVIASIGPVTSEAVRSAGLIVDIEAGEATLEALAAALTDHLTDHLSDEDGNNE